jgi:hypothetical protein
MTDSTKKDVLLVEDPPADLSLTQTAAAHCTAKGEQVPPEEGAARSRARLTQVLPPLPQPQSRGWPQTLLLLLVLGLLARMGYYKEPTRQRSVEKELGARQPSLSAPGSRPASGTASPPLLASPASTGPSQSASPLPAAASLAAGALEGELRTATASPVQAPVVRAAPQSWQRPDTAPHRLHIRAKQEARLLITIDGQRTIEFLLRPGQAMQWSAQRDFMLTSKNAGAVVLTLDGHKVSPLGNARQLVRYLRLPAPEMDARPKAQSADRPSQEQDS